jgi:hypothetical protein
LSSPIRLIDPGGKAAGYFFAFFVKDTLLPCPIECAARRLPLET